MSIRVGNRCPAFRVSGDTPFGGFEHILGEGILRNRRVNVIRDVMLFPDSDGERIRHRSEPFAGELHMLIGYLAKLLRKNGEQRQIFTVFGELPDLPM